MAGTRRRGRLAGLVSGSLLVVALTGCPPYGGQPRSGAAYYGPTGPAGGDYVVIQADSDFYEPLSPYGRWQVVGSYGRCWIPGGVGANWSPYSNGYWQDTDAGWYWVSNEPWGWATYHYGRWDSNAQLGWYWVPQTQWAPAWVSWRQGGGYVGWAPLGPAGRGDAGVNRKGSTRERYVFVEERRFLDPVRPATILVNNTVMNRTTVNKGPGAAVIERASGRRLQAIPVRQLRSKEEAELGVRRPAPLSIPQRAVPDHRQPQNARPAREPAPRETAAVPTPVRHQPQTARSTSEPPSHPAAKAAGTTDGPPSLPVKNEPRPATGPNQAVKPAGEHAPLRDKAGEKGRSMPVATPSKPEARSAESAVKHQTQQAGTRAKHESAPTRAATAAPQEPADKKEGKDGEKKN